MRAKVKVEEKTSSGLDDARQKARAYEYLCHLEEARCWLQECLGIGLPPASQLGKHLANGVALCKVRRRENALC